MKTINSLQQAYDLCKGHQVTAQELINGRAYINGEGWQDIELDSDFKSQLADLLSELYGGHSKTKNAVYNTLKYGTPQHWGLSRTFIEDYGTGAQIKYCAGQDYIWECNAIRTALK